MTLPVDAQRMPFIMTKIEWGWGYSPALRPSAFHLHPYADLLLILGDDWCQMVLLVSIFIAARALASWFIKSGPTFHQTLIGLGLASTSHRMLATDCFFLHPEQCLALATDPGPNRPAKLWLSDLTSYYQDWLPTPTPNIERQGLERLSTHTNTLFWIHQNAPHSQEEARCHLEDFNHKLAFVSMFPLPSLAGLFYTVHLDGYQPTSRAST